MRKRIHQAALAASLLASQVVAQQPAEGPSGSASGAKPLPPILTVVSGSPRMPRDRPVIIEYLESPKLTTLLRSSLATEGFPIASSGAPDAVSVRVRGVLQLTGKHTARIPIAELAEEGTLVAAADGARTLAPADLGYVIAAGQWLSRLTSTGQLSAPAGGILLFNVVGQATGAKDWFNRAAGGDRRGVCLVNCENWNKTRQAAYHVVDIQDGTERRRAEVKSELLAEDLQPGRVVSTGLAALVDALSGKEVTPDIPHGTHDERTAR